MSAREQLEVSWAINNGDKAKAVRLLKEHGYSVKTISLFTGISEEKIRFMVRRE